MRGLLGVVAALALAAASAGCQQGTAAADLKVGNCFNRTPSTDANGDNVLTNTLVECSQPHDAEVFLIFDVAPGPSGYPGDEAIGTLQQTRCQAAFVGFVGRGFGQSSYTIDYVRPDSSTWSSGNRTIACLIEDASAGRLTGSAKGTKK